MDYDPRSEPHNLAHDPTTSLVVPRPIGWITTISPQGVVNLATYELRTQMNVTGGEYPEDVSEPELAKLAMAPSRFVKPPRVAASPIALECVYSQTVSLERSNGKPHNYHVVFGEVVNVHVDDAVIVDGMIDMSRIRPIARLGYRGDYTVVDNIFEMKRV